MLDPLDKTLYKNLFEYLDPEQFESFQDWNNYDFFKRLRLKWMYDEEMYDYSLVKYVNAKTPVKIICRKHGIFERTPTSLLNGSECKECRKLLKQKLKGGK